MFADIGSMIAGSYSLPSVPPAVVASCMLLLGFVVLLRERFSHTSSAFFLLCASGALWLFGVSALFSTSRIDLGWQWAKLEHLGVVFIPSTLFNLTLFMTRKQSRWRLLGKAALYVSGFFAVGLLLGNDFIRSLNYFPWGPYPQYGWLGNLFLGFFAVMYLTSLSLFWRAYRRMPEGEPRERLKQFCAAFGIGIVGTIDFFPCYGLNVYPSGYIPTYFCVLVLAQAIWRHRFADLSPSVAANEIVKITPHALFVVDQDGLICVSNRLACQLLNAKEEDLIGMPLQSYLPGFLKQQQVEQLQTIGVLTDYELMVSSADSEARLLNVSASTLRNKTGRLEGYVCLAKDITEQRRSEEALMRSEQRLHRLGEANIIGLVRTDAHGVIREANQAFLKMTGHSPDDLLNKKTRFATLTPADHVGVDDWIRERLKATGVAGAVEKELIHQDGSRIPVVVGAVRLDDVDGDTLLFVVDVSERRRAQHALQKAYADVDARVADQTRELQEEILRRDRTEETLRNQAVTDSLTGLYNRRGFNAMADHHMQVAVLRRRALVLFMIDVDNLKPINDTFGHPEGDQAIKAAAHVLRQTFRQSDVMGRLGGDEFAVLTVERNGRHGDVLLRRIQEQLDLFNQSVSRGYRLNVSVGMARVEAQDITSIDELIQAADKNLYLEKANHHANPTSADHAA